MQGDDQDAGLTGRLIDTLYGEAMLLADEARGWFDSHSRAARRELPPLVQIGLSCEALKVTTRLMHVIGWLLDRRAVARGEISSAPARFPPPKLGGVEDGEPALIAQLPEEARQLIEASRDLYARVQRVDHAIVQAVVRESPARGLFQRLEDAF